MPTGTIKRLVRDRGFGCRAASISSPKGSASRSTKRRHRRARAPATFVLNPDRVTRESRG